MSNQSNERLAEVAREFMEELTGTIWERLLERDLEANDLEALRYHIAQAQAELAIQEESYLTEEDMEVAMALRKEMLEDGVPQ